MRVYVVTICYDYEGDRVIGVYSTRTKAEQVVEDKYNDRVNHHYHIHFDWNVWEVEK